MWGTVYSTHKTHTHLFNFSFILTPHALPSFLAKTIHAQGPLHQGDKDVFLLFIVKLFNLCKTT